MKAKIIKHPIDYTGKRIPIEGFNIGDIVKVRKKRKDGLIFIEGTIHGFGIGSLEFKSFNN
jgi:hypothetical protein